MGTWWAFPASGKATRDRGTARRAIRPAVLIPCLVPAVSELVYAASQTLPSVAVVERDGMELEIPTSEVVIGDVMVVRPGSKVPAVIAHNREIGQAKGKCLRWALIFTGTEVVLVGILLLLRASH